MVLESKQIILHDLQKSRDFALSLARDIKVGSILLFNGELGSGKTFLCQEIIRYFCGASTNVTSPTFNILHTYDALYFTIYHFDLYRLHSTEEIYEIGLEDALQSDSIILIEWPSLAIPFLSSQYLTNIYLSVDENQTRICKVIREKI